MNNSKCLNCGTDFSYYGTQRKGKFCNNKCQGEYTIKGKLCEGTTITKAMRRYLNEILGDCCSECGQGRIWNNKVLILQIDHINGNIKDNRVENLRLLCPNCHTQTDNWGSNNVSDEGKAKLVEAGINYWKDKSSA